MFNPENNAGSRRSDWRLHRRLDVSSLLALVGSLCMLTSFGVSLQGRVNLLERQTTLWEAHTDAADALSLAVVRLEERSNRMLQTLQEVRSELAELRKGQTHQSLVQRVPLAGQTDTAVQHTFAVGGWE